MRKTAFVKVSGDLIAQQAVLDWIKELTQEYFTVVCIGGGTQISQAFEKRGFPIIFGPLGRETQSFEERQLARDVLEENQAAAQDLFAENGITATVIIPVRDIGSVLCHINGDVLVREAYHGFDKLFILTLSDRIAAKFQEFESLPKISVIGF